jgi:phosphate transport system substrate-binding protein
MRLKRASLAAGAAAAFVAGAVGVTATTAIAADKLVQIDGSSTVYPITEAVAEEFQKAKQGAVKVTVGISGTGGGFKKFCRGETDISDASRPILKEEMAECAKNGVKYVELPIAFDALTVAVSKQNSWVDYLTVAELKTMWGPEAQGKITNWKQIRSGFPDAPLQIAGAGADSGTFDYFTEAIVGKAKASRGDYTASEDDNVLVQGVQRDVNAIGYFGYAYYAENQGKLKAVPIIEKAGRPGVLPALATVLDGSYQPLSRPIFIYVNAKAHERAEVKRFVDYYLVHGAKLAKEVKYVPLPDKAYALNRDHLAKGRKGTVFGGVAEVGVRIEDLLAREARL